MPTIYTPPFIFTASHTLGTLSLTSLSTLMIATPHLYHKHILRSTSPSTTDLFTTTQFTNSTQQVLHATIRSSGVFLLGTTLGLLSTRNSNPSTFTIMTTVSLGIAAGHAYLLKDTLSNAILRNAWLEDTERVTKMGVVVGVNLLTGIVGFWAAVSYGGWPWGVERTSSTFFAAPAVGAVNASRAVTADDFDIEGVVNVFVKGAVELAGGVTGIIQGFLNDKSF
ncbi:hypothetical protein TWF694_007629 [Orbilia ellipsospora]|uniref:Uncharacterized protein n=1 Tax=Orbilia ellipsospora TaxID=2528407 RepID=A0AAV9XK00_9PEZI